MRRIKEFRQKNIDELKSLLEEKKKELVQARLDLKLKRIKNVHKPKSIRKEIARILTIIKEKQIGKKVYEDYGW